MIADRRKDQLKAAKKGTKKTSTTDRSIATGRAKRDAAMKARRGMTQEKKPSAMEVEREVLTQLEGFEPVDSDHPGRRHSLPDLLVKEQAVAAEAVGQASGRRMRDTELARDLPEAGAGDQAMEDGRQQVGSLQPVAHREGL